MTLIEILRRFRRGVAVAMLLVVIEKIAWILEPTVFGRLLDALIETPGAKRMAKVAWPLAVWIAAFAVNSIVGALRRSVDERIFLNMFTSIAVTVAESSRQRGADSSLAAMRTELSREYVTFLQHRLPELVEQVVDLVGAVIALAFFDKRIALTCLGVVVPLGLMNSVYSRRVILLQKELHDHRESLFAIFRQERLEDVRAYYDSMARPQMTIADWGAVNFGILRLFLLAIFLVVLFIAIGLDDFSTGQLYSVVAYLWTFVTGTEHLPSLMESYSSLKEIQQRVRTETPPEPGSDA